MTGASISWYRRKRTRELALVACFLVPALTIFVLYRLLPLGWNVLLSFQSWSPLKAAAWIGVDHYEEMLLDDDVFWDALSNTLIFIGCSPIAIALALAIALLVNSDLRGAAIYRTIVFLSYPLMTVAVGIIWRWLYDERGGFFNYVLRSSGVVDQPVKFLQSFDWALPCVIAADFWQVLGFYMIILLKQFPGRRWVVLLFLSCMLIPFQATIIPAYLITSIYKAGFGQSRFDYAAALTVVQFLLLVVLTMLANKLSGGNAGSLER